MPFYIKFEELCLEMFFLTFAYHLTKNCKRINRLNIPDL